MARILLAEDDSSMRAFLSRALERVGHTLRVCADGYEAEEALEEGGYDLLLTDIVMPGPDGIEIARRAAERYPQMRIVFITGFAAVALTAPEGSKVLSKPIHLRELVGEVDRMLAVAA